MYASAEPTASPWQLANPNAACSDYHADRHGVAVFQDMPEKYGNPSNATIPLYLQDLRALIGGPRANHPSILQWTPL